jgi:hypothetical protein
VPDPSHVVLLPSATTALNLVIAGCPGRRSDAHVIFTALEHNSVLRRIEHQRRESRVSVSVIEPDDAGRVTPARVRAALQPATRLVCVTHASNVTGVVQPIDEIAEVVATHGAALLVDAAQSAGCVPLSWRSLPGRVFVAFAGHKGLFGPTGTGGLIVPDADTPPLVTGGTGHHSESAVQPGDLPTVYEAGTPNLPGIEGLEGRRPLRSRSDRRGPWARAPRAGWPAPRESWGIVTRSGLHMGTPGSHRQLQLAIKTGIPSTRAMDHPDSPERNRARHSMNSATMVLHCHHYATLYCQLAEDAGMVNGRAMMAKAAEYSFLPILKDYFAQEKIAAVRDRAALAEEYWRMCGMGTLSFEQIGRMSATARMDHSHVDEGWIKKWGKHEKPVNFISQGYLAAALAAIYDQPAGSYSVQETQSIVAGAQASRFAIVHA